MRLSRQNTILNFSLFTKALVLCCVFGLVACKKDPKEEEPKILTPDIYVCGFESNGVHNVAKFWKNGNSISLTDGKNDAYATSIFVVDTNVYVSGVETISKVEIGRIWKNGKLYFSTDDKYSTKINSIAIEGNDIYAVGEINDYSIGTIATFWKNGISMPLDDSGADVSLAKSIVISESNVYIAGTVQYANPNGVSYMCYWKNGSIYKYRFPSYSSWGNSIAVKGSDVYLAGYGQKSMSNLVNGIVCYQGSLYGFFDSSNSDISSIFISERNNVHCTGRKYGSNAEYGDSSSYSAFLISSMGRDINLYETSILGKSSIKSYSSDVFVFDAKVYAVGADFNGSQMVATIWKNKIPQSLTDGLNNAGLTGIFIK